MKLAYFISFFSAIFFAYIVSSNTRTVSSDKNLPNHITKQIKNIYNYDQDKVIKLLLSKKTCTSEDVNKNTILLTINLNAKKLENKILKEWESEYSFSFINTKPFKEICEVQTKKELLKIEINKAIQRQIERNYHRAYLKKLKELEEDRKKIFVSVKSELKKSKAAIFFDNWEQAFRFRYEEKVTTNPYFSVRPKFKEVLIAVIDTGYDFKNPLLKNAVPEKYLKNTSILDTSGQDDASDKHSHGTHVAGIILGVMPQAKILPIKYYNPKASGQANLDATIAALNYAIDEGVDMINYSGGGPEASVEELRALKRAEKKGIIVIAAAGNERSNIDDRRFSYYPASYGLKNIVTIGNHYEDGEIFEVTPSSNYGKKTVDFMAKGHRVFSIIPNNMIGYMTGTSQSTPVVTGLYATLMAENPDATHEDIMEHIIKYSKPDINHNASKHGFIQLSKTLEAPLITKKMANRLLAGKKNK